MNRWRLFPNPSAVRELHAIQAWSVYLANTYCFSTEMTGLKRTVSTYVSETLAGFYKSMEVIEMRLLNTDERRQIQLSGYEILLELKKICEKFGLRYYLTAGTLLGAVRHGGFIPWDDDIDVAMPRKDYDRLAEICRTELPDTLFFQSSETDVNFPCFFSKIRMNGTEVFETDFEKVDIHKGRYIDIFPLDPCPRRDWAGRCFFAVMKALYWAYLSKVNEDFTRLHKKWHMKLIYCMALPLSVEKIRSLRNRIARLPSSKTGRLCTVGGMHGYPREVYEEKWFEGTEYKQFETELFPVPSGWDQLLTNMYGDYMTPPDEADMAGHFLTEE